MTFACWSARRDDSDQDARVNEQPRLPALVSGDTLLAPMPGWFRCTVADQEPVSPDDVIGDLDVLGRTILIIAPAIRGVATYVTGMGMRGSPAHRRAVGYGDALVRVVAAAAAPTTGPSGAAPILHHADHGLVFRAPTAGRFYARPSPDKAVFVSPGTELTPGAVVCLLEVMKTFSRITYSGAPCRVRAVLVSDGADVTAGQPLLELEPV